MKFVAKATGKRNWVVEQDDVVVAACPNWVAARDKVIELLGANPGAEGELIKINGTVLALKSKSRAPRGNRQAAVGATPAKKAKQAKPVSRMVVDNSEPLPAEVPLAGADAKVIVRGLKTIDDEPFFNRGFRTVEDAIAGIPNELSSRRWSLVKLTGFDSQKAEDGSVWNIEVVDFDITDDED